MIMAGGDRVTIVEPVLEIPVIMTYSGPYIGLAYGFISEDYIRNENSSVDTARSFDEDFSSIMLHAGYKFNSYVAVEGRYWFGIDDVNLAAYNDPIDAPDGWGIYVKPMYPIADAVDIYGLLGYASIDTSLNKLDGFSWGVGASYAFTDNVSACVDYVSLHNDDRDLPGGIVNKEYDIDTVNVGITYNF